MNASHTSCSICPLTKFVCFWGELTVYARWRRVLIFFGSLLLLCLPLALFLYEGPDSWMVYGLAAFLTLFSLLGLVSSIWGCNRCVVRMFGEF